jgi:glyoxylase-like metal-dependent hydrolase (beta-lactamase superfamily II)
MVFTVFSMPLKRVSENIYMVKGYTGLPSKENKGFISNAYGILTEEGWIVVDSLSTPELAREFINELKKVSNKPIKYLIITHYHLDHYFGASEFKKEGATIVASEGLLKFYESGQADMYLDGIKKNFGDIFKNVKLVKPDIVVKDKETLKIANKDYVNIVMTPAHTNSDLVLYSPSEKVAFVGDLVFKDRVPFVGDQNASSKNWLNVLEKLKSMDSKVMYNGHNNPLDKSAIDFTYEYIKFLREEISRMKDEGLSYDEIKEKLQNVKWKKYLQFDVFHDKNIYKIYNELDFEF